MRNRLGELIEHNSVFRVGLIILVFIAIVVALTLAMRFVLGDQVLGIDFLTFWTAAKSFFFHLLSPYSDAVVEEIQRARYQRLAVPGEDPMAFVYPLFMLLLVFPYSLFDFPHAQALWFSLNLLLLTSMAYLSFSRKKLWMIISIPFIYPVSFSLILGNFNLLIGLIFFLFYWAYFSGNIHNPRIQTLLGISLAFTLGKPQFGYLLVIFACLILLKYKMWRALTWFFGTFLALVAVSFAVMPGWFSEWLTRIKSYPEYMGSTPINQIIFSFINDPYVFTAVRLVFQIMLIGLLIILLVLWLSRPPLSDNNFPDATGKISESLKLDLFILALASFIIYFNHPFGKSYEQIILLVPFFLWAAFSLPVLSLPVKLFWWINLSISWIAFIVARLHFYARAIFTLPVAFFAVWLIYLWLANRPYKQVKASYAEP